MLQVNDTVFTHSCSPLFVNLSRHSYRAEVFLISYCSFTQQWLKPEYRPVSSPPQHQPLLLPPVQSVKLDLFFFLEKLLPGLYSVVNSAEVEGTQPCFLSACVY